MGKILANMTAKQLFNDLLKELKIKHTYPVDWKYKKELDVMLFTDWDYWYGYGSKTYDIVKNAVNNHSNLETFNPVIGATFGITLKKNG